MNGSTGLPHALTPERLECLTQDLAATRAILRALAPILADVTTVLEELGNLISGENSPEGGSTGRGRIA